MTSAPASTFASSRIEAAAARAESEHDSSLETIARLKARLIARSAEFCASRGWRRIALYGAGRHTRLHIRQPWAWHGVQIVVVIDDEPATERIGGVPVRRPADVVEHFDAIIVSSECYEGAIHARAQEIFGARGTPILRIYGDEPAWQNDDVTVDRLVRECGVVESDARWLVANRRERHDATLPMLPPARTELHLRRYELASKFARSKRVLDAACGTGYGAALLVDQGEAARVIGVDLDPAAADYARRRFGRSTIEFRQASAAATGLPDGSVDLVTSFETIEHVPDPDAVIAEFARVLTPGGRLVISTPNDWGLTEFHAHSFTPDTLRRVVSTRFTILQDLGQRAGNTPARDDLPPGMFPMDDHAPAAETLLIVADKR